MSNESVCSHLENGNRKDIWFLISLSLLTVGLYLFCLPKEFTNWDDPTYIIDNSLIRSFSWAQLNRIITEPYFANYAPLTLLSYSLDYHLWGLNPTGFHFHNVALHLGCLISLFLLLQKFPLPRGVVYLTTLLFAVHPINTETVSWASERKNLLATLFFFLSFHQYIQFRSSRNRTHYLSSILFFMLSLLSKASTVVAPLVFLAYDWTQERKSLKQLSLYDKLPFIVLAEIYTFLSIHAASSRNALYSYHGHGPLFGVFAIGHLCWEYLKLMAWPSNLSPIIYPMQSPSWSSPAYWLTFLLFVALAVYLSRRRQIFFWGSFFVIFLLPVLNIVPLPVMMANRYLYLPQVGIWAGCSWAAWQLYERIRPWKLAKLSMAIGVSCWLLFLCWHTVGLAKVWRNSYNLWTDSIQKYYFDPVAHYNLGMWYQLHRQPGQAGREYLTSLMINPRYALALSGLGNYYLEKGKKDLALKKFYTAINVNPDLDLAMNNLGNALARSGDIRRALYMLFRATYINPDNLGAFNNIVTVYLQVNKVEGAREIADIIIRKFPERPDGYWRLGICLEAMGEWQGALQAWEDSKKRLPSQDSLISEVDQHITQIQKKLAPRIRPKANGHG